jgi:hypothetical protein
MGKSFANQEDLSPLLWPFGRKRHFRRALIKVELKLCINPSRVASSASRIENTPSHRVNRKLAQLMISL